MTKISAIISTRNRPELIGGAVRSILANIYSNFDVVVVDQSDDDLTRAVVCELAASHNNLRYVHTAIPGVSRARNLGVHRTGGEVVAFTDDDCVVAPDWLSSINAAFEDDPEVGMLYGQVLRPVDSVTDDGILPTLEFENAFQIDRRTGFRLFGMTANFAARRFAFEQVGGFDEVLGPGAALNSGEDFDFQYRAFLAGVTIAVRPEVRVDHYGFRDSQQWNETQHRYGSGDAAFYLKHVRCGDPFACAMLVRRVGRVSARELLSWLGIRRRGSFAVYLRAYVDGTRESLRFGVDRRSRLYRDTHAPRNASGVSLCRFPRAASSRRS